MLMRCPYRHVSHDLRRIFHAREESYGFEVCGFMLRTQIEDGFNHVTASKVAGLFEFPRHRLYSAVACSSCFVPLIFAFHVFL